MSVFQLGISIIALFLASIIFTVINWIFLSKLSFRISSLEKELEKKSSELATLKKERTSAAQVHGAPASAVRVPVHTESPVEQQAVMDGAIQIVRNVGGVFKTTTAEIMHASSENSSSDDLQAEDAAYRQSPAVKNGVVIPLFSPVVGGADFNRLYQSLVEIMKNRRDPQIAFDCAGIQALSDQELDYMEKLYRSLLSHKRSLVLVHCNDQLVALLQRKPLIAAIVR
jgi:hypothetical protein